MLLLTANAANFEATATPLSRFLVGISSSPIFMMVGLCQLTIADAQMIETLLIILKIAFKSLDNIFK